MRTKPIDTSVRAIPIYVNKICISVKYVNLPHLFNAILINFITDKEESKQRQVQK